MADHLARIFGTEEDKINCPFYYKIGACRHGERCSRKHMKPNFSQTILIPHLYQAPAPDAKGIAVEDDDHFADFFEEILDELKSFGEVEQLNTVENLGDHMFGNVYVKYKSEEQAESCLKALSGRYYAGRMIVAEYSPVTDFREARCRQFDEDHCARGGYCNFMHLKHVPRDLRRVLKKAGRKKRKRRSRSRDRSRRSRKSSRSRSRSKDRTKKHRSRSRSRSRDKDTKEKVDLSRSDSAERRAKIAEWNKARSEPIDTPTTAEPTALPPAAPTPASAPTSAATTE